MSNVIARGAMASSVSVSAQLCPGGAAEGHPPGDPKPRGERLKPRPLTCVAASLEHAIAAVLSCHHEADGPARVRKVRRGAQQRVQPLEALQAAGEEDDPLVPRDAQL